MSAMTRRPGLFESKRGRVIRENLTAYLFLSPALLIIFLFGIFPVAFAFFVSLHRWRRFPEGYRGLDQYVRAVGDFAYVTFFWIALGLLLYALFACVQFYRANRGQPRGLLLIVPGAVNALGLLTFINWFFLLLPAVLNVPVRMRGQQATQELFVGEFLNSFQFPEVAGAADEMALGLLAALAGMLLFTRLVRVEEAGRWLLLTTAACLALALGGLLMHLTLVEIDEAAQAAREAGESLPVWSHIILISAGAGLLLAAYLVWQRATRAHDDRRFALMGLATVCLVLGGYLLIVQLPIALADADRDVMNGFSVTIMYSLFSVPFQLIIGLGLAVLLFQNIRGKAFFRMVYFLPYITPFVATSVIFALLFSHRNGSPVNQLMRTLGLPTQNWLLEPQGIFRLMFGPGVPDWLAGPGLALVVIIIYNVWVYAGYATVIFLAGLGNIPREMYEAAKIDGAAAWASFRHITLPLLSPTTFFLILIATIGTFQAFTQIFLMRRPGAFRAVDTINIYIYDRVRSANPDYAYGSAMAFVLFAVILILTLIQNRLARNRVFYG